MAMDMMGPRSLVLNNGVPGPLPPYDLFMAQGASREAPEHSSMLSR